MLRTASRWSGLLISVVLLALIASKVRHLGAVGAALRAADYRWVLAAVLLYLASFLPRGLRWGRLLGKRHPVPLGALCQVLFIGFMANNVLPLRLGEFVRAYALGRRTRVSATTAFATIVMERIADGLTLVLALAVISLTYPFPAWVKRVGFVTAALFLGAAVFLGLFTYRQAIARGLVQLALRPLPALGRRADHLLEQFDAGLHLLRSPLDAGAVFSLSALIWALEFGVYTRVLAAFAGPIQVALGHQIPLHVVVLLLIVVNFGIMIPSGPAYLGTFQAAAIAVLAGIALLPEAVAFSIAWVLWATMVLPTILVGFLFLARSQLSLASLTAVRSPAAEAVTVDAQPPVLSR